MPTESSTSSLMPSYARLPISFVRGAGARLWDSNNREYLDALGGIAVCALGHSHPAVTAAINQQAETLLHTSNLFGIDNQEKLAAKLCEVSGMETVFFGNSGAEANEAAIKISRLYARQLDVENPVLITFNDSFHGRTMATLSATGNPKVHAGFEPRVSDFLHLPYNDIEAVQAAAAENPNIVAIMVEPILGEGGVVVPDPGFLPALREICYANEWLMMADEIQTGVGRTGHWYASSAEQVMPDVMTTAKSLGNGVPIGACMARGAAANLIQPGHHGSTFGGNPFCSRVALAVLETIDQDNLVQRAASGGERLRSKISQAMHNRPEVVDIRGRGMMTGIQINADCSSLVTTGLQNGVVFNVTAGNVLRMLPPYTLTDAEIDEVAARVCLSIETVCEKNHELGTVPA